MINLFNKAYKLYDKYDTEYKEFKLILKEEAEKKDKNEQKWV